MKKLMMMAAVACAASFASAAAWSWRAGTSEFTIDGKTAAGNAVMLVMSDSGDFTLGYQDGKVTISGGTIYGINKLGSDGKDTTGTGNVSVGNSWDGGSFSPYGVAGADAVSVDFSKHDYYEVIFDSATISAASKYQIGNVLTDKAASKATGNLSLAFGGAALKSENWTNIPEPCTVALLALGMGALALRRKQR